MRMPPHQYYCIPIICSIFSFVAADVDDADPHEDSIAACGETVSRTSIAALQGKVDSMEEKLNKIEASLGEMSKRINSSNEKKIKMDIQ